MWEEAHNEFRLISGEGFSLSDACIILSEDSDTKPRSCMENALENRDKINAVGFSGSNCRLFVCDAEEVHLIGNSSSSEVLFLRKDFMDG